MFSVLFLTSLFSLPALPFSISSLFLRSNPTRLVLLFFSFFSVSISSASQIVSLLGFLFPGTYYIPCVFAALMLACLPKSKLLFMENVCSSVRCSNIFRQRGTVNTRTQQLPLRWPKWEPTAREHIAEQPYGFCSVLVHGWAHPPGSGLDEQTSPPLPMKRCSLASYGRTPWIRPLDMMILLFLHHSLCPGRGSN